MRIGRLEFGVWTTDRKLQLKEYAMFDYDHSSCGCRILMVSRLYFTWLGNECYPIIKKLDKL